MNLPRINLSQRFPALASRDFAIFWVGHLLSLLGTSMQNTAQPLLAYRLSGRPFDLGLIGFALTLPIFFLALPGGVLIEHVDKRKTVMVLQAVMMLDACALAYLTLAGVIQIWHILALSLLLGIATAFEITARQAMLVELVGREALPNAIALQSTAFNLSRVLGPALVAPFLILIPDRGEGWIFLFNAVSFLTIIIGLFFVKSRYQIPPQSRTGSLLAEIREGMQYIGRNASVGFLIVIAAILGLFAFPFLLQLPVISKDLLGQIGDTKAIVDARNGWLYTAQGVGALIASIFIAVNNPAPHANGSGYGRRLVLGEAAFILGLIAIPFAHRLWSTSLLIALIGWGSVTQLATMNTLIQLQIPDGLRGRVFSIYLWALQGVAPFGSLLVGGMTEAWGLGAAAITCGTICLAGIGGIHLFRPAVRRSVG